jgi:hypothetical protein
MLGAAGLGAVTIRLRALLQHGCSERCAAW